jgi:general secretion pathway protein D
MEGEVERPVIRRTKCISPLLAGGALAALLLASSARTLAAQDTNAVKQTAQGILVDFQDTDLRTVISALAEAAGLNVVYSDLPSRKVTVRLRTPVAKSAIPALLQSLAQSNGMTFSDEGGIIRFASAGAADTRSDTSMRDVRLYVHQLKHARAAQVAATMQTIFGGARSATAAKGLTAPMLSQRLRDQAIAPTVAPDATASAPVQQTGEGQMIRAQLRGEVQIVPDERTNALVIRALPGDWETLRKAIDALDLRPLQALIEVVIAEVRTTDNLDIGTNGTIKTFNNATPPNTRSATSTSSAATDFVLKLTQVNKNFTADIALAALATRGNVRILSRPIILAQNNAEAKILVGEQRPFVQVFRSLPTDAAVRDQVVQYRDVATSLTILPTINPDGYVNLQVLQEVSSATSEVQFGAPIISTREASTHLFVKNGQTAVLGGLVGRQTDVSKSGIPWFSRIPILGALFGTQTDRSTTSEIFLFLTPHVISSDDDADALRDSLQRAGTATTGLSPAEKPILEPGAKPDSPKKP